MIALNYLLVLLMLVLTSGIGFALRPIASRALRRRAASSLRDSLSPINKDIEKDKDKVVHNMELKEGEKCVLCRCWKSGKFPLCDGAHVAHNKETGDNVGPVIVSVSK